MLVEVALLLAFRIGMDGLRGLGDVLLEVSTLDGLAGLWGVLGGEGGVQTINAEGGVAVLVVG